MLGMYGILLNVTSHAIATKGEGYDHKLAQAWMAEYWWISLVVSVIYMLSIWLGGKFMRNREAIRAQKVFNTWNILLSAYSISAFYALWPEFVHMYRSHGWYGTFCLKASYWEGTIGFWAFTFHWSKIVELGDTAFLVLRKRKVLFLHWYHHVIVLCAGWYCFDFQLSTVRFGTLMNVFVHSVMYSYFALHGLGMKMPRIVSMTVTALQIIQFIIGLYICAVTAVYVMVPSLDVYCDVNMPTVYIQTTMYFSFLLLFAQFFYKAYLKPKPTYSKKIE